MNEHILILGTSHTYQYGAGNTWNSDAPCTERDEAAFRQVLVAAISDHDARAVFEEMNEQALAEVRVSVSVPQFVALDMGIKHVFCEPDRAERAKLEIEQENDIRLAAFFSGKSEQDIENALKEQFRKRESVWFERIRGFGVWPVLLVCGANHVPTFSTFLSERGSPFEVLYTDWQP